MDLNGFNNIFSRKTKGVLAAAAILAVAGLASRLLGFFRNALLAYFYGAGDVLDAYFLAFRLPDFFFNLFFFGAFSAGFVPVFIKLKSESAKEAWRLASDVLSIALVVFALFGAVFFVLAPWVLGLIAPGFGAEKLALAVMLSRIMFLQPIFLGVSVVFSGILQSTHRFLSYALAPIFYNIGIILGILVLAPRLGPAGLAWGVVAGALLHMLAQYPAAKAGGFKYRPSLSLERAALRRIFRIIVPRSLSLILAQLNLVVIAGLASFLGSGRVSVFNFANDLGGLMLGVAAVPLGVAVFPALARSVSKKNMADFAGIIIKTLRQLMFVMIPAAALFFVLRAQIVRLTLGYGKFDWVDTVLTIETLGFLLAGLVFQGVLAIILRGFFALEDAKTTFLVLLFGVLLSVAVSLVLSPVMDVSALGLALSLAAVLNTVVLMAILRRRVRQLSFSVLVGPVSKFVFASLAAAAAAYAMLRFMDIFLDTHRVLHLMIQGGAAGAVGLAVYIVVLGLFDLEEIRQLKNKLRFNKIPLPSLDEETHQ